MDLGDIPKDKKIADLTDKEFDQLLGKIRDETGVPFQEIALKMAEEKGRRESKRSSRSYCPSCGEQVEPDHSFCSSCGQELN